MLYFAAMFCLHCLALRCVAFGCDVFRIVDYLFSFFTRQRHMTDADYLAAFQYVLLPIAYEVSTTKFYRNSSEHHSQSTAIGYSVSFSQCKITSSVTIAVYESRLRKVLGTFVFEFSIK